MTTAIVAFVAAVLLALVSLFLFGLAVRQLVARQTALVAEMLGKYDGRLAEFAQALNDALVAPRTGALTEPGAIAAAPAADDDPGAVLRTLELAREKTASEAAIAVVTNGRGTPTFATVGLSQAEAAHVGRMGFPDYRGARALQVAFSGEVAPPPGNGPVRSGLVVPLFPEPAPPTLLAVISRADERRFSEDDIEALEGVVFDARPALERTLALREPDPVPQLDPLTQLYDRQSFNDLLDREIHRARTAGRPLALLVVDVDRLTTLNARIGHLAADAVLAEVAERLRTVAGRTDYPCRVGGGRYAVLQPGASATEGEKLFESLRVALHDRPIAEAGIVSVTGGVAELLPGDDAAELLGRVDAALGLAKGAGRGTVVSTAIR
jgi:diguanylate cyclase (GGDEF)-like protein